jgi:hypothetical protein
VGILHSLCVSEVHDFFSNPFVGGKTGRASEGREVANDIDAVPHNSEGCGFTLDLYQEPTRDVCVFMSFTAIECKSTTKYAQRNDPRKLKFPSSLTVV